MKEKGKEKGRTFHVFQTGECLKVDKNKLNFCKYPIFASSHKQLPLQLELMDYFTEAQRKDFHMLKLTATCDPFNNQPPNSKVFTIKAVENGEEVTNL